MPTVRELSSDLFLIEALLSPMLCQHVIAVAELAGFQPSHVALQDPDISVVGYLNDDFEGGETAFDRQELQIRPKQGAVLVFPSFFTYPHQALAVTSGRKYVFTTWLYHSTAGQ